MESKRDPVEVPFTAPIPRRIILPRPDTDEPLVPNEPYPDEGPAPSFAPIPETPEPDREREKERPLVPA